ncbi:NADPH-dependent FMN reductase [Sphingomonas sp.]|jgi:FMN reductase|uniref:NADPH-dependent FMN reductase n=1 Tax=Sphingomonas sp. TaxID=28214 RepID=UPI002ED8B410
MTDPQAPLIVGLGGTVAAASSSERITRKILEACAARGARTRVFAGAELDFPTYGISDERCGDALALVAALREAGGVVIVSPGYHGTISGMLKNALDYVQDMAGDERPYLDGRAVGLAAVAAGWQATGSTLATLRAIAHALRGWPTPLGVTINSLNPVFDAEGGFADPAVSGQVSAMADQLMEFARMRALAQAQGLSA